MNTIMIRLLAIYALSMLTAAYVYLRDRMMFKLGLRDLGGRGAQCALVTVALLHATLMPTAAFTTGDTIDYSIEKGGCERLQRIDIKRKFHGNKEVFGGGGDTGSIYVKEAAVPAMEQKFR